MLVDSVAYKEYYYKFLCKSVISIRRTCKSLNPILFAFYPYFTIDPVNPCEQKFCDIP